MIYTRYWIKVALAAATALTAGGLLVGLTRPPHLSSVPVLTISVNAMQTIPTNAVHWIPVKTVPKGALTSRVNWSGLVASQHLPAGTILTNTDFTTSLANGLHPGEVQWLAPVSAASSGLASVGQRVDVWSDDKGAFHLIAQGVRVIGLYSSSGSMVASTGSGSGSPTAGMVGLAVPATHVSTFLNVSAPYLIVDPNQTAFHLTGGSTSSAGSTTVSSSPHASHASHPSTAKTKKKTASLPASHGGG